MNIFRLLATASLFMAASFSTATAAITVTNAKIAAGVMTVSGTSTTGTHVSLDGLFTEPVGAGGAFSFSVPYHAEDCIVRLTSVGAPTVSARNAVVADCGPRGVIPRGAWLSTTAYVLNNLVTHAGSTWRAKQPVPAGTRCLALRAAAPIGKNSRPRVPWD
jgi:hypothetical protein